MITSPHNWIEISKSAFHHNISQFKSYLRQKTNIGIVVKSNAYGHGLTEIGALCQENPNISWLFTATLSEALLLRKSGVTKSILVLYTIDADPLEAIQHTIDLMAGDKKTIEELNALGAQHNAIFSLHLKIDTGMYRFGFFSHEMKSIAQLLQKKSFLKVNGVYTHLSSAASSNQEINRKQEAIFNDAVSDFSSLYGPVAYIHSANSAGTTFGISSSCNLVRIGLGAYGWWSSAAQQEYSKENYPSFNLKPVISFKTKIVGIKEIPAHTPIGYDQSYITKKKTRVAILPIGYYHGYDRRLSNIASVYIQGKYVPIIGLISMTITMINITDYDEIKIGDEVVILGNYEKITPASLALLSGTKNIRESMTRINPEIIRIIVP